MLTSNAMPIFITISPIPRIKPDNKKCNKTKIEYEMKLCKLRAGARKSTDTTFAWLVLGKLST